MKIKNAFLIAVACVSACSVVPFSTAVTNDFSITANAAAVETTTYENFKIEKTKYQVDIIGCVDKSMTELVVPAEIDGLPVKSIKNAVFQGCKSLTSATILAEIEEISYDTFGNCTSLKEVKLPESITSIGARAFKECSSLTDITIPDSVTKICDSSFEKCSKLEKIIIPKNVSEICLAAFTDCESLSEITFAESDTNITIGNSVFKGCTSLKKIFIPKNVNSIFAVHNNVFENCTSLESIEVDENNENYASKDGVLFNKDFTTLIKYPINKEGTSYAIPESVKEMSSRAFHNCKNLTSVEIPKSITNISYYAFAGCSGFTEFEVPEHIEKIGAGAFANCSGLTKITIKNPKCEIFNNSGTISNVSKYSDNTTSPYQTGTFNGTICCYEYTKAKEYAMSKDVNCDYESMGVFMLAGDSNGDFGVDIADAVAISAYVGDPEKNAIDEPKWIENGDVQSKGNGLNANDSLMIQQYLAGIVSDLNS